ncbi:type II toxin-antitoxin system PemK/MazF family toxin [Sphingomonas aerolata]|uniref:type II toxin-antitoxin system PemK/MazF family toxin n=1 Tax=Sphingomonas aerolata TaxID=185951 RepID=UPI002FE1FFB0
MSNDDNSEAQQDMEVPFPTEAELFAAGYAPILTDEDLLARGFVPINFKNMPAVEDMTTELGHPFPRHNEIIKAGYIPISRRERRIQSRPRVGQMYWVDFPHDAYVPEFVNEHPGIVIRASNSLSDTCIILPVTSAQQKAGTHFHQLSKNPNPRGHAEGRIAYVVCDHLYTVHVNRLRPLLSLRYVPVYPKVEPHDMTAIFAIVEKVLALASASSHAAAAAALAPPAAPAKPLGPNTLTLKGT